MTAPGLSTFRAAVSPTPVTATAKCLKEMCYKTELGHTKFKYVQILAKVKNVYFTLKVEPNFFLGGERFRNTAINYT